MDIIGDLDDEDWESLICSEGKSDKFWRGITVGEKLFVHYGKVGNKGTYQQKTFGSEEQANIKQLCLGPPYVVDCLAAVQILATTYGPRQSCLSCCCDNTCILAYHIISSSIK